MIAGDADLDAYSEHCIITLAGQGEVAARWLEGYHDRADAERHRELVEQAERYEELARLAVLAVSDGEPGRPYCDFCGRSDPALLTGEGGPGTWHCEDPDPCTATREARLPGWPKADASGLRDVYLSMAAADTAGALADRALGAVDAWREVHAEVEARVAEMTASGPLEDLLALAAEPPEAVTAPAPPASLPQPDFGAANWHGTLRDPASRAHLISYADDGTRPEAEPEPPAPRRRRVFVRR